MVTLPALPSLGAVCPSPQRFVGYYLPNGCWLPDWVPTATGSGDAWQLAPGHAALADLKSELLLVTGLENQQRRREFGDHALGCGAFLTARKPGKLVQQTSSSVDQVLAESMGGCTKVASLQLGTHNIGPTDAFGSYYTRSVSWRGPREVKGDGKVAFPVGSATPLYKETDPRLAFDRLFAGPNAADSTREAQIRRALRKSVLDVVTTHGDGLRQRLGAEDRVKVDQLFTGIRELEREMQTLPPAACAPGPRPTSSLGTDARTDMMGRLIALAFQCDITRVATFMIGDALNGRDMSFLEEVRQIGGDAGDHAVSHHQRRADMVAKFRAIGRWKVERLAQFIRTLRDTQDADGRSLLDSTLVVAGSDIADGDSHRHDNMPLLMAGRLGGRVTTNRHVRYAQSQLKTFGDFYITLLGMYGVQVDTFGDDGKEALAWR